jgi:hypothetical protein
MKVGWQITPTIGPVALAVGAVVLVALVVMVATVMVVMAVVVYHQVLVGHPLCALVVGVGDLRIQFFRQPSLPKGLVALAVVATVGTRASPG